MKFLKFVDPPESIVKLLIFTIDCLSLSVYSLDFLEDFRSGFLRLVFDRIILGFQLSYVKVEFSLVFLESEVLGLEL